MKLRAPRSRTAIGALAIGTALGIATPMVVAAASADNSSATVTVTDSKLRYGQRLVVKGQVPPEDAGRTLALEMRRANGDWRAVATGPAP